MSDFEDKLLALIDRRIDEKLADMQSKTVEQLLSTAEAATVARVSTKTIREWVRRGWLRCDKSSGRLPRYRRIDLDRAMESMRNGRRSSNDNASIDDMVAKRFAKRAK